MQRLINIQNQLNAPKNQRNSFGGYNYRSAEDILEAVKPLLKSEHCALTLNDDVVFIGDRFYIKATATLFSDDGKQISATTAFAREASLQKGKDESQITGTASSYARKYALNGLFCIDDNKDADTDEHRKELENTPKSSVEEIINGIVEKMTLDNWKAYYRKAISLYEKGTAEYKLWSKAFNDKKAELEKGQMAEDLQSEAEALEDFMDGAPHDLDINY